MKTCILTGIFTAALLLVAYDCPAQAEMPPQKPEHPVRVPGKSVPKDLTPDQVEALFSRAVNYSFGNEVPKDQTRALKLFRQAAEHGYGEAAFFIGSYYMLGKGGLKSDTRKAAYWYRVAAKRGDPSGQVCLAQLLLNGDGIEKNVLEGFRWAKAAADQGNGDALNMLGNCYYEGNGVAQDRKEARRLWRLAVDQGNQSAREELQSKFKETYFPKGDWENGLGMIFVRVPAGEFTMGTDSGMDFEKPPHRVRLTKSFLIGKYEVTYGQFSRFVRETKYVTARELEKKQEGNASYTTWRDFEKLGETCPVAAMEWKDAKAFCEWLNRTDRKKPTGHKYRLPTEAEWEYSARGNDARKYPWGNTWNGSLCNYGDKSALEPYRHDKKTSDGWSILAPVGSYAGKGDSPFGACDMAGNVYELCEDFLNMKEPYPNHLVTDPFTSKGSEHSWRGGCFMVPGKFCDSALRWRFYPGLAISFGFRVVLVAEQ